MFKQFNDDKTLKTKLTLTVLGLALALTGCRSLGPSTIKRDRFQYANAVSDSWKEQLLLNIVRARYADVAAFVEVSSMVSGYSLESKLAVGGEWPTKGTGFGLTREMCPRKRRLPPSPSCLICWKAPPNRASR